MSDAAAAQEQPDTQQQSSEKTGAQATGAALPEGGLGPGKSQSGPPSALPGPATSAIGLTGELAEDKRLEKFENVEALAKSYLELESASGNAIRIPGDDASDAQRQDFVNKLLKAAPSLMVRPDRENKEQMDQFYQTLGRPPREDAYKIPEFKDAEGNKVVPDQAEALQAIAFRANLSQDQYDSLVADITKTNQTIEAQNLQSWGERIGELKKEWGQTYDEKYRRAADIAMRTGAPPEVIELLKSGFVAPETLKWLDGLADALGSEGRHLTDDSGATEGKMTPAEAQDQLNEMMNNKKHPLWDTHHPDHERAVKKRLELQMAINPEASTDLNQLRAGAGRGFDS